MHVEIEIVTRPVQPRREPPPELAGAVGAVAEFAGLVRAEEDGRLIAALEYEAYAGMAERVMRAIIAEIGQRQPCLAVRVVHRVGVVPVGELAIHCVAFAKHRAAALAMVTEFMDRLKQAVPIWKRRGLSDAEFAAIKQP
jgi:molybdopterin synthase catalytic subunit